MGKRASRAHKSADVEFLQTALHNNAAAAQGGPRKKKWSGHDLKTVKPLTPAQDDMFHAWFNGMDITAQGSAGTGKTFVAFYLALTEVIANQNQQEIILVRSVVPTRQMGFLPGDEDEKASPYERPYKDILWDLVGKPSTYEDMKEAGVIRFITTSHIRGMTWDNAVVIVDECENLTIHEINSVMTRVGKNSRVIFAGDFKQTDLDGSRQVGECGMPIFLEAIRNMGRFEEVIFRHHDIVRSDFCKSWIIALEQATGH